MTSTSLEPPRTPANIIGSSSDLRGSTQVRRFWISVAVLAPTAVSLVKEGLHCVGCDINIGYLRKALSSGVPVVAVDSVLPFEDRSFDSVLLLEVIEHVANPETLLKEAFRVARKNVLITVPNSEDIELMRANDVTYAHMLSSDHINFFSPDTLRSLLTLMPAASRSNDPIRFIRSGLSAAQCRFTPYAWRSAWVC